jgi:hypothetical protein
MADKAQDIIEDALALIFVDGEDQPIQPGDFAKGVRFLNRMMLDWQERGIALGFTEIQTPSDPMTTSPGANMGIAANLAIALAPIYGEVVTGELLKQASDGYKTCLKLGVNIESTPYESTLPTGSGNTGSDLYGDSHFYPGPDDSIQTESDGNILVDG